MKKVTIIVFLLSIGIFYKVSYFSGVEAPQQIHQDVGHTNEHNHSEELASDDNKKRIGFNDRELKKSKVYRFFKKRQLIHDECRKSLESLKIDNLIASEGHINEEESFKQLILTHEPDIFYIAEEEEKIDLILGEASRDKSLQEDFVKGWQSIEPCDFFDVLNMGKSLQVKNYTVELQKKVFDIYLRKIEYATSLLELFVIFDIFYHFAGQEIIIEDVSEAFIMLRASAAEDQEKLLALCKKKHISSFSCIRSEIKILKKYKDGGLKILRMQDW